MALQCGCRSSFGDMCTRAATQEDLLCDQCRDGRHRNAVMIYTRPDTGLPTGGHHHLDIDPVRIRL